MANLLIRDLTEDDKRRLRIRAAEHGRSLSEEARLLLTEQLAGRVESKPTHWVDEMLRLSQSFGGVELEQPPSSDPKDPFAESSDSDAK